MFLLINGKDDRKSLLKLKLLKLVQSENIVTTFTSYTMVCGCELLVIACQSIQRITTKL